MLRTIKDIFDFKISIDGAVHAKKKKKKGIVCGREYMNDDDNNYKSPERVHQIIVVYVGEDDNWVMKEDTLPFRSFHRYF